MPYGFRWVRVAMLTAIVAGVSGRAFGGQQASPPPEPQTQDVAALYRAFRGRDPSIEPLLEARGLK